MDAIRVAKVEDVLCRKPGYTSRGSLHLTAHHLIFKHDSGSEEEMWVPYPLISLVTRMPQTLQGLTPLTFQCRTFRIFSLLFRRDSDATDVFESVRELTVSSSVSQLYAFYYVPNPPFAVSDGWSLYSPREEYARMGVGSRTKAWRFTDINKDYTFCPTYPARLVIPTRISDATLQYASKYRSKCRIPALVYLHWANFGTITRSSQPMVGLTNSRSIQDEKLVESIFQSHHFPESRASASPVYGATSTNLIIDARPTTNAMANVAKGAGTENMDHYKEGKKAYLGVDNIHVMRDSLGKVTDALREADALAASINRDVVGEMSSSDTPFLDRQALRRSGWLRHISAILDGTVLIVRNVHVNSSHVLIHCSDGWDRTAQLSSLAQLCLDPFYRTVRGFQILVEKDWLSFGHRFLDRCGHLSSEKFFLAPLEASGGGGGAEAAQAFLASVQNKFVGQHHLREISPVFHQFLECVRQIQRQYPERFEFNGRFLEQLHYHLYSCQFGTFLSNNERGRRVGDGGPPLCDRTVSVWDFFNSPSESEKNLNPSYDPTLDDASRRDFKSDMGVLIPNAKDVRFWHELYGRTDEEMNGRMVTAQVQGAEVTGLIESAEDDFLTPSVAAVSTSLPSSPSPSPSPALMPSASEASADNRSKSPAPSPQPGSSSMPDLTDRPTATRLDSFRAFGTTASAFSLRPRGPSPQPESSSLWAPRDSPSTSPGRSRQTDIFSGAGVKSMWGKLSSNASAAFTAVQGAYDGVSKDFKGLSVGPDSERELSHALGTSRHLEEDIDWPSQPTTTPFSASTNSYPSRGRGPPSAVPSVVLDNPWGSYRANERERSVAADDIFSTPEIWADNSHTSKGLPPDPTRAEIPQLSSARPPSLPQTPYSTVPRNFGGSTHGNGQKSPVQTLFDSDGGPGRLTGSPGVPYSTEEQMKQAQQDPLGVGLI